jgi:hypothetical protein
VIQRLVPEERQVEFVGGEPKGDVLCQRGMTLNRRERTRASAFIGDCVGLADSQRKMRVMVEDERRYVVVVDKE